MTTLEEIERCARMCVESAAECLGEAPRTYGAYTPEERFKLASEVFLALPWSSCREFSEVRDVISSTRAWMSGDATHADVVALLGLAQAALARLGAPA